MFSLASPVTTTKAPPPNAPAANWATRVPKSNPFGPTIVLASPPPTRAPMIWAPIPPPTMPASKLPICTKVVPFDRRTDDAAAHSASY